MRWLPESPDGRPPLPGRVIGLSVATLVFAVTIRLLADTLTILVPLTVPLLVIVSIGYLVFRRMGRF